MEKIVYLLFSFILAFSAISGVIRFPAYLYLGGVGLFLFYSIALGKHIIIDSKYILLFYIVCFLSVFVNNPPSYFRSFQRVLVFLLVLSAFTPLIKSKFFDQNRLLLYNSIIFVLAVFAIGSFFCYFLGINYFVWKDIEMDMENVGHFSGLTNHSMVLGPISAISAIFMESNYFKSKDKKKKLIFVILCIFSLCAVLMSASRGAIGAALAGIVIIVYQNAKSRGKLVKYGLGLIFLALLSSPIWGSLISAPMQKNERYGGSGVMISREGKFVFRLIEIQNNFLTGVGFAAIDPDLEDVDQETGHVEPSTSWLAVFSMTGVFGFALFVFLYFKYLKMALKKIPDTYYSNLLSGIMIFFGIHMLVEGYVLSAGNILCGMFWLTLGVIDAKC